MKTFRLMRVGMDVEKQLRTPVLEQFKQRYGRYQNWFPDGDHWLYRQIDWIEERPVDSLWGDWLDEMLINFGYRSRYDG